MVFIWGESGLETEWERVAFPFCFCRWCVMRTYNLYLSLHSVCRSRQWLRPNSSLPFEHLRELAPLAKNYASFNNVADSIWQGRIMLMWSKCTHHTKHLPGILSVCFTDFLFFSFYVITQFHNVTLCFHEILCKLQQKNICFKNGKFNSARILLMLSDRW